VEEFSAYTPGSLIAILAGIYCLTAGRRAEASTDRGVRAPTGLGLGVHGVVKGAELHRPQFSAWRVA
jgi:hypothetical protein